MIDPRTPDYTQPPTRTGTSGFSYARALDDSEPVVSIVTPYFNACPAEFQETARCVLSQSLQAFEWLIVNDGSTDPESIRELDRWRDADPRVRVIDLEANSGPSAARNQGYEESACEFVFQLDADDLIEPTTIEKCLWHALTHPDAHFVNTWEVGFGSSEYLWRRGFNEPQRFLQQCLVGAHMVLVRKSTHRAVGGYDETIRGGMEDWEFWLRCADHGYWGSTLPEFLSWYRRRENHAESWENWDGGERQFAFRRGLKRQYSRLHEEGIPWPKPLIAKRMASLPPKTPLTNPLQKSKPRLVMIVPWMRMGGADKFNVDLIEQLIARGWEVTVISTLPGCDSWVAEFARFTPDIFPLATFCHPADYPVAMRYLIESRRPDVVMITNSDAGYQLLPYLRSVCPEPAYVDYNHMEETNWREGGHPRTGAAMCSQLDLCITASEHVRAWMVERGAETGRVEAATINVDPKTWKPDPQRNERTRARLGIDVDVPIILYAGRICDQKQPDVFALSVRELATRAAFAGQEFVCLVAGDGELRGQLEDDLKKFDIVAQVRMLGEVTSDEMVDLMSASDIFFLPSRWEGIALVFYEAMASGVVIVGADVGGQRELVTPECGVLLAKSAPGREAADEPGPYADALLELICDSQKRDSMAAAARQRICQGFTIEQMGDRMHGLLRQAIELHKASPREALPASFAHETALRATDQLRMITYADRLCAENHRLRDEQAAGATKSEPTPQQKKNRARARARRGRRIAARRRREARARRELRSILQSRSWRLVTLLKANPAYWSLARVRWGPGWRELFESGPPSVRLERITSSRAFRLIQWTKRLRPARRKAQASPIQEIKPIAHQAPPKVHVNGTVNGSANGSVNGSLNGHATRTLNADRSPSGAPSQPD